MPMQAQDTLATKHDLLALGTNLRGELAALRAELYMAILGQMAVLLGFAYFFATHLR
jgi:hypothetical protein